jgi:transposase-like protein
MPRIAPSERIEQALEQLLNGGLETEEQPVSHLIRLAATKIVQHAIEGEVSEVLGRERYERRGEGQAGLRNGYEPGRIRSAEGEISVQVPQVRGLGMPYRSKLMDFLRGNSDVLEYLVVQMYTRGLSTRDIEEAFRDPLTGELLLGRSAVSELTDSLWEDYQAFCQRDLSGSEIEYLFLDAVYESLRQQAGLKEGVLVAWGICRDGRKVLLHMTLGNKESLDAWLDMVRDMVRRGLRVPTLITTDGAPGLIAAVEQAWPRSLRQRCLAHKQRNILDKVPDSARQEVKAALNGIYYADTRQVADLLTTRFLETYGQRYPSAVACFTDDLEACLAFLKCPSTHHSRIRTTNLLERAFLEQRRRTNTIPRFFNEKSCLKLVFATLWQASQRWQNVRMSDAECALLDRLRRELGLDDKEAQPIATANLNPVEAAA